MESWCGEEMHRQKIADPWVHASALFPVESFDSWKGHQARLGKMFFFVRKVYIVTLVSDWLIQIYIVSSAPAGKSRFDRFIRNGFMHIRNASPC